MRWTICPYLPNSQCPRISCPNYNALQCHDISLKVMRVISMQVRVRSNLRWNHILVCLSVLNSKLLWNKLLHNDDIMVKKSFWTIPWLFLQNKINYWHPLSLTKELVFHLQNFVYRLFILKLIFNHCVIFVQKRRENKVVPLLPRNYCALVRTFNRKEPLFDEEKTSRKRKV